MTTRVEQKEKRKQEILTAALRLFVKKGYAATQIKDIAEEAGMSTGLMFHYFDSKEKLYEELVGYGVSGPQSMMGIGTDHPLEFFRTCAVQILNIIKEQPMIAYVFILMAQAQRSEGIPEAAREMAAKVKNIDLCVPIIEAGQKQGSIRQGDPLALSMAFWCSLQGIVEQAAMRPELPIPQADWLVDILANKEQN